MIIGIDFDNTIIKYDELFHKISIEKNLIPKKLNKEQVWEDFKREAGGSPHKEQENDN